MERRNFLLPMCFFLFRLKRFLFLRPTLGRPFLAVHPRKVMFQPSESGFYPFKNGEEPERG